MPQPFNCPKCNAVFSSLPSRGTAGLAGLRLAAHMVEVHKLTVHDAMLTAVDVMFTTEPAAGEWPDEVVGLGPAAEEVTGTDSRRVPR